LMLTRPSKAPRVLNLNQLLELVSKLSTVISLLQNMALVMRLRKRLRRLTLLP